MIKDVDKVYKVLATQLKDWGSKENIRIIMHNAVPEIEQIGLQYVIFNNSIVATGLTEFLLSQEFIELYAGCLWYTVKKSKDIKRKVVFPEVGQLLYENLVPLQKDLRNTIYDIVYNNVNDGNLEDFFEKVSTWS